MNAKHIALLQELGLTEKESAVYLALLETGSAGVAQIARHAGVKRPTAYFALDTLLQKGLASFAGGKTRHYVAAKPEKILTLQQARLRKFEQSMPELLALVRRQHKRPAVRMVTGEEGVRAMYEESLLLPSGSEILSLGNAKAVEESLPGFGEWYIRRRVKARIRMRAVVTDTPYHRSIVARDAEELRKTVLLSDELFTQEQEINLYGDTVAVMSFADGECMGMLIDNAVFASGYRQMFDLLWRLGTTKT